MNEWKPPTEPLPEPKPGSFMGDYAIPLCPHLIDRNKFCAQCNADRQYREAVDDQV